MLGGLPRREPLRTLLCLAALSPLLPAAAETALDRARARAREMGPPPEAAEPPGEKAEASRLPDDPAALVRLLGDGTYAVREAAQKALEVQGEKAETALREGAESRDAEVSERSRRLLDRLRVARRDAALKQVTLTLAAPRAGGRAGEEVPFRVAMTNTGKAPVLLLKCLDGSGTGRRGPFVFLEVKDAEGRPVPEADLGGKGLCGNTNQLTEADFFTLKPGETCDPFALAHSFPCVPWRAGKPGRYVVTLVWRMADPFETDPGLNGPVDERTRELEAGLPRGEIRSNPVAVEIAE